MSETNTTTTTGDNNSGGEATTAPERSGAVLPAPDTEAAASAGGAGVASEATGSAAQDGGVPHPSPSPTTGATPQGESWERRRLNTMTARAKEYTERLAKYENPDGTPRVPPSGEATGEATPAMSQAEIERLAEVKAERILFNREAERVATEGRNTFPDFDRRVQQLVALTDGDPVAHSSYVNLVRVALETGQGAQILHRLGGAPEEAERLLRLNPVQQAIQVARLIGDGAGTGVSGAPKPITPVNGGGTRTEVVDPTDPVRADKLSTSEWMKRRNAQIADKRKRA